MTGVHRLYYMAGQEAGFRRAYMHRARLMSPGPVRSTMVKLARASNWERHRYLVAARGA